MADTEIPQLLGTYATPSFRYGDMVVCEQRGQVELVGLTAAPIPWPIGKNGRSKAIVLFGDLVKAVKRESAQAVCHYWGVGADTVWKWRKALGVTAITEGTSKIKSENAVMLPGIIAGREKARGKAKDPTRRAKIAAARRGKPRPASVGKAVAKAHKDLRASDETRKKMSESHRKRGTRPPKAGSPWTPKEDALVRTLPAADVARKTGRTLSAVYNRRIALEMPDGRK